MNARDRDRLVKVANEEVLRQLGGPMGSWAAADRMGQFNIRKVVDVVVRELELIMEEFYSARFREGEEQEKEKEESAPDPSSPPRS